MDESEVPHWMACIKEFVNELVLDPRMMERFREQVRCWSAEMCEIKRKGDEFDVQRDVFLSDDLIFSILREPNFRAMPDWELAIASWEADVRAWKKKRGKKGEQPVPPKQPEPGMVEGW